MGNATSCTPSITSNGATKVLSTDGKMEVYTRAVKAAEIMLENPGKFVADADSLKVGHRIQGLSADEELEKRQLYFLLPMELLYSVLTHEEMASFTTSYNNHSSKSHTNTTTSTSLANFGKNIFPSLGEFCMFLPNKSEAKALDSHSEPCQVVRLYSKQRSWRPALETIVETPPCRSR